VIQDQEFENWREQWTNSAEPLPETQRIRKKIKRQERRFILDNLFQAFSFLFGLYLAFYIWQREYLLGSGFAAGVVVFLFIGAGWRLWVQRGTWRADTQSTRSFLELWRRRVVAKIRILRFSVYLAVAWIFACVVLGIANWGTLGLQLKSHPSAWILTLVVNLFALPLLFAWVIWLKRRKLQELTELSNLLSDVRD
jgi:hypothetical protein